MPYLDGEGGFLGTLSINDLNKLRKAVKKVHMDEGWPEKLLTNYEVDKIIDHFGRETLEKILERNVNKARTNGV